MRCVLERPKVKRLLSTEHFSIDGTLIEAWASMKSFKAKEPPQDDSKSEHSMMAHRFLNIFCPT